MDAPPEAHGRLRAAACAQTDENADTRGGDGEEGPQSTAGLRAEAEKLRWVGSGPAPSPPPRPHGSRGGGNGGVCRRKEANAIGQAIGRVETQRDLLQSHAAELLTGSSTARASASDEGAVAAAPLSFGSDFSRAWEFSEQVRPPLARTRCTARRRARRPWPASPSWMPAKMSSRKSLSARTPAWQRCSRCAAQRHASAPPAALPSPHPAPRSGQALGDRKASAKTRGLRDVSVLARTSSVREAAVDVSRRAGPVRGP